MTIIRNLIACLAGLVVGSIINMAIVVYGPVLIPPPAGVDVTNAESLAQGIHLFEARHFIAPFLAHALGTLSGAFLAALIAVSHKTIIAYIVGMVFLAGGVAAAVMIPAPVWFIVLDLGLAYLPMALIAAHYGASRGVGGVDAGASRT